jgi:type II secretory pathway pseudopilin PulG
MKNKRSFTILEIMIALMVISIVGAVTAFQVKKLIDVHQFESGVSNLFIALQEAQVLSATYQTDISLDLFFKKGTLFYRFSTNEPFKPHQFYNKEVPLANTAKLMFKEAKVKQLHFDIYSGGRIEPRGILAFYQSEEDGRSLWFDLQYGHLLKFAFHKPPLLKLQLPVKPKKTQEKDT